MVLLYQQIYALLTNEDMISLEGGGAFLYQ